MHACLVRSEPRVRSGFLHGNHIAPSVPRCRELTQVACWYSDQLMSLRRTPDGGAKVLWQWW